MTTVAFDGKTMAADTLATDCWGLKEECNDKIKRGKDFLIGFAGEHGQIERWWKSVSHLYLAELLDAGYEPFVKDSNDPSIVIGAESGCYRHVSGMFFKVSRGFHAVGSGRDYALAAMHCGRSAKEAVLVAMEFDNGTGGEIVSYAMNRTETKALTEGEK